jgi:hypothetical protein
MKMAGINENEDLDHELEDDLETSGTGGDQGTGTETDTGRDSVSVGDQADGSVVVELPAGETDQEGETDQAKGDDEAALEAKRAARRAERAEQKQRRAEKDERLRRELASERTARQQLEQRLAVIERRAEGGEVAQIDASIQQAAQQYNYQKQRQVAALQAGNAEEAADAVEKMMTAREKHNQLTNVKQAFQQRQQAPKPLDTAMRDLANTFMSQNAWYKAEGTDPDSTVTRALDNSLVQEGFDPRTQEYWDELSARVKKYLPHRVAGGKVTTAETSTQATKPKSTVAGSGRDSSASGGAKATFKLSADRVQAMKDAGVWDNPQAREKMIQSYRAYDKSQGKA